MVSSIPESVEASRCCADAKPEDDLSLLHLIRLNRHSRSMHRAYVVSWRVHYLTQSSRGGSSCWWVCPIAQENERAADDGCELTVTAIEEVLQENDDTETKTNMSIYVKKRAHECMNLDTLSPIGEVEVA